MNTPTLAGRTTAPDCELQQFQRRVFRIVANIVVNDADGKKLCHLQSKADFDGKPLATLQELVLGFIGEWKVLFKRLQSTVRERQFGHLQSDQITLMDVVSYTGTALLSAALTLHKVDHEDKSDGLANDILDLKAAIHSLSILQLSYEINPEDDALDALAIAF
jgi:hypothetical protein